MPQEQQNQDQSKNSEKVTLDAETYNQLLDDIELLRNKATEVKDGQKDEEVDLDRMSQTELANYIANELTQNALNPVMIKLAQIELNLERQDMKVEGGYDHLDEKYKDILGYMHKHPTLSMREAYQQVIGKESKESKESKEEKSKESEESETKQRDDSKHLPLRPAIHGEKPSSAATSQHLQKTKPKDTREAAQRAIEDLKVKFPDEK